MFSSAPFVCFGEVLWDVLPTGRQVGGAPSNVALHLHQLGQSVQLISRVGDDELGQELLAQLANRGLAPTLMQRSATHLTGMVKANVQPDGAQVSYKIARPMAWDYIRYDDDQRAAVEAAPAFIYGTLATRHAVSRETLYRLLQHARFKVFDLNLRPPHYSRQVVKYLFQQADLVKINQSELAEVMAWFGQPATPETALPWLCTRFDLQAVCLTLGAEGATLFAAGRWWHCAGFAVPLRDPIGCGDAFLAALLADWPTGADPGECLRRACAAGAVVASRQGATTALAEADLQGLMV